MEGFDLKIKVFKNTPGDKGTLHNIIQEFIDSNDNNSEIAVVRTGGNVGAPILKEFFNNLGFHIDCNGTAEENLSRKDLLDRTGNTMSSTSSPAVMPEITFRLYNCDHTCNLDRVEALITKVTTKLSLKAKIEQEYFPLPKMSELCVKLEEEGKQPGYAVFVVHAHESSLVINTNNLYAGYSMLYRTLLRLTDDRVLIVIGGDDNYKDQEERDKKLLSRKMWSKICSQFNNKYINGVKSFIFSWEENHHPIHEEALEFYLDPKKKGQEFVPKTYPPVPKDDHEKKRDFPKQQPDVEKMPEKNTEVLGEAGPKEPPDALRQLLVPQKTNVRKPGSRKEPRNFRPDESRANAEQADAEIDIEKGRLRYRALVRIGRIFEVQKSDPPGWEPEKTMVKHLLQKHKSLFKGLLEFWESKDGKVTAVVTEDAPFSAFL